MRAFILAIGLMAASPLAAQESCICLKCLFGQHHMVQAASTSMSPTLEAGDCRYARYLNGAYERLAYGDIIYFQHPVNDQQYLDRLIAKGGDTVQMVGGIVWLNGEAFPQEQIADYEIIFEPAGPDNHLPRCQNRPERGGICRAERFTETAPNGRSYEVLNLQETRVDNTEEFIVPEGFVFVLGDHRDNAIDSRFPQGGAFRGVGFVPLENIIGIVEEN